jgi:hypothetical protein
MPRQPSDLSGRVFGHLTVLRRAPPQGKTRASCVECRCICGAVTIARTANLLSGNTKSCGCRRGSAIRHGHARRATRGRSPTYVSWAAMINRCTVPSNASYKRYGARGVTVCARWLDSFAAFLSDMGDRPEGTSLDRYPNRHGDYAPGNCRWATPTEQRRNQDRNT